MNPDSRKPLWISLFVTSILVGAFAGLLAVNENLRTTTFVLLEKVVNEEGEEEVRVKVEKPKPNEAQVKEIARNRERKKEDSLTEKAKEIRDAVREIREAAEVLRAETDAQTVWDRFFVELSGMVRKLEELRQGLPSDLPSGFPQELGKIEKNTQQSRVKVEAFSQRETDPEASEIMPLLDVAKEMAQGMDAWRDAVNRYRDQRHESTGDWTLSQERRKGSDLYQQMEDYKDELMELMLTWTPSSDEAMDPLTPDEVFGDVDEGLPLDPELEEMSVSELYDSIQDMAEMLDEAYADQKAGELALTEHIDFEEAREQIFAPETPRGPDLEEALSGTPETLEQYEAYSEALDQAERTAQGVARVAENRQAQVRPGTEQQRAGQTAESLQNALSQRAAMAAQMNTLAMNTDQMRGRMQDMTGLMRAAAQNGMPSGSQSEGMSAGFSTDLNSVSANPLRNATSQQNRVQLSENRVIREAIPGRKLDPSSARQGWIFLDTWYIIGPWDRPNRNSFDTRFPPETEVDLDATYVGKEHPRTDTPMELEWRFVQTENIKVNPPDEIGDAVYYGYTEVFAERAMEVVVAVASDDIAKLWINDLVVWQEEGLSSWRLDEGFRKIYLKPGFNKVLIRVENGPSVCYFSVLLCPADALGLN